MAADQSASPARGGMSELATKWLISGETASMKRNGSIADVLIRHIGIIGASIEVLADILASKPLANGPLWFSSPVRKPFPQFAGRKLGRTDLAMRPREGLLSMPINCVDRMAFTTSEDVAHGSEYGRC
jgi:hypothetical protein